MLYSEGRSILFFRFLNEVGLSEFSVEFPHSGINVGGHSSEKIKKYYST